MSHKLRQRLALLAALPEPILLERLGQLRRRDLLAFWRLYGICKCLPKRPPGQRHEPGRAPAAETSRRGAREAPPPPDVCRCRRSLRAEQLSYDVHIKLFAMLWPANYEEPPPPPRPSPALTTHEKSRDLQKRFERRVALFHEQDLLQENVFETEGIILKALAGRVDNGYDVRDQWVPKAA